MKKSKWDYQGKTKKQVESSDRIATISMIVMILLILIAWMFKL
jgi:hypothetical protein